MHGGSWRSTWLVEKILKKLLKQKRAYIRQLLKNGFPCLQQIKDRRERFYGDVQNFLMNVSSAFHDRVIS